MRYLKTLSSKLAVVLGEEDKLRKPEANIHHVNALLELDYPYFSSILPYRYYWPEHDLLVNENSLGFGLELTVLSGADEKMITNISDLLRYKIPDAYEIQILFGGFNQVGPILENNFSPPKKRKHEGIYDDLAKLSFAYYQNGAKNKLKNKRNLAISLRDYRLFLFVSKKTAYSETAWKEIVHVREDIIADLESADIGHMRLRLNEFLALLRTIINPDLDNLYPRSSRHEALTELNEQVVDKSFELFADDPDFLTIEVDSERDSKRMKTKIANLSVRTLPDQFALWMVADNFFNVFRSTKAISCPFLISVHARMIPQAEAKSRAQSRYLSMEKKAKSVYAKYISGTQQTAAEWKKIRDDLATDEVKLVETFFNVVLFSKENEEKRDVANAIACFKANSIELFQTKYIQLQSFLATLPFLASEGLFRDLKRAGRIKTLTTWNLANLLPLVADYKMAQRGLLLTSFRNQIAFLNPYDPTLPISNFNIAVAATSGAGKSFLIQALLSYVLSIQGICFVIDMGESYRKFCETVGGTYLSYHQLRLNPFTNIDEIKEYAEQIRDLLVVLASPSGELEDVQEEYLREAVMLAWEKKKNAANVDTIIEALAEFNHQKEDRRIVDLITLLKKYSTQGTYTEVFNTHSALAPDAKFVVLELGELENKPDLLKAVLFALMINIEEQMYQSPRNLPKMVVIDEAWRLLAGDNQAAARFIEKGYRTARRHLGSFVTITQGIDDFMKSREAKACFNNSAIKITMLQNPSAFDVFVRENEGFFDAYTEGLIRNFKEAQSNGFSEFMLQLGQVKSFNRLFVDPFSRVMFSSSGIEYEAVKKELKNGLSISESISKVARQNYADEF